jgi:hypothetical protein
MEWNGIQEREERDEPEREERECGGVVVGSGGGGGNVVVVVGRWRATGRLVPWWLIPASTKRVEETTNEGKSDESP